jgi:hypothetical protein
VVIHINIIGGVGPDGKEESCINEAGTLLRETSHELLNIIVNQMSNKAIETRLL